MTRLNTDGGGRQIPLDRRSRPNVRLTLPQGDRQPLEAPGAATVVPHSQTGSTLRGVLDLMSGVGQVVQSVGAVVDNERKAENQALRAIAAQAADEDKPAMLDGIINGEKITPGMSDEEVLATINADLQASVRSKGFETAEQAKRYADRLRPQLLASAFDKRARLVQEAEELVIANAGYDLISAPDEEIMGAFEALHSTGAPQKVIDETLIHALQDAVLRTDEARFETIAGLLDGNRPKDVTYWRRQLEREVAEGNRQIRAKEIEAIDSEYKLVLASDDPSPSTLRDIRDRARKHPDGATLAAAVQGQINAVEQRREAESKEAAKAASQEYFDANFQNAANAAITGDTGPIRTLIRETLEFLPNQEERDEFTRGIRATRREYYAQLIAASAGDGERVKQIKDEYSALRGDPDDPIVFLQSDIDSLNAHADRVTREYDDEQARTRAIASAIQGNIPAGQLEAVRVNGREVVSQREMREARLDAQIQASITDDPEQTTTNLIEVSQKELMPIPAWQRTIERGASAVNTAFDLNTGKIDPASMQSLQQGVALWRDLSQRNPDAALQHAGNNNDTTFRILSVLEHRFGTLDRAVAEFHRIPVKLRDKVIDGDRLVDGEPYDKFRDSLSYEMRNRGALIWPAYTRAEEYPGFQAALRSAAIVYNTMVAVDGDPTESKSQAIEWAKSRYKRVDGVIVPVGSTIRHESHEMVQREMVDRYVKKHTDEPIDASKLALIEVPGFGYQLMNMASGLPTPLENAEDAAVPHTAYNSLSRELPQLFDQRRRDRLAQRQAEIRKQIDATDDRIAQELLKPIDPMDPNVAEQMQRLGGLVQDRRRLKEQSRDAN